MDVDMRIEGAEAAREAIRRVKKEAPELVAKEIKATALAIERGAKKRARVDTGRMRASIHPEFENTRSFTYEADGETYDGKLLGIKIGDGEAAVGSNVAYFPTHELGSVAQGIAAKPMLRPAAEAAFRALLIRIQTTGQNKLQARVHTGGISGVRL